MVLLVCPSLPDCVAQPIPARVATVSEDFLCNSIWDVRVMGGIRKSAGLEKEKVEICFKKNKHNRPRTFQDARAGPQQESRLSAPTAPWRDQARKQGSPRTRAFQFPSPLAGARPSFASPYRLNGNNSHSSRIDPSTASQKPRARSPFDSDVLAIQKAYTGAGKQPAFPGWGGGRHRYSAAVLIVLFAQDEVLKAKYSLNDVSAVATSLFSGPDGFGQLIENHVALLQDVEQDVGSAPRHDELPRDQGLGINTIRRRRGASREAITAINSAQKRLDSTIQKRLNRISAEAKAPLARRRSSDEELAVRRYFKTPHDAEFSQIGPFGGWGRLGAAGVAGAGENERFYLYDETDLYEAMRTIKCDDGVGGDHYSSPPSTFTNFWSEVPIAFDTLLLEEISAEFPELDSSFKHVGLDDVEDSAGREKQRGLGLNGHVPFNPSCERNEIRHLRGGGRATERGEGRRLPGFRLLTEKPRMDRLLTEKPRMEDHSPILVIPDAPFYPLLKFGIAASAATPSAVCVDGRARTRFYRYDIISQVQCLTGGNMQHTVDRPKHVMEGLASEERLPWASEQQLVITDLRNYHMQLERERDSG
ncbi:hypothetical protein BDK51DRAFT_31858 [Blyttiomyces helicus]|uniref:Uncharacterized protein n=1 Tax=Blyttiomyces helicus TaxID=388810 RepID=A0A4P9W665_9FUNG|nr:hypothetical protein BDK51DRAFT_31858 [Blyttiomyces helicus]|eukprot:RKO86240.1 hypothetical protein BDK51DRAFT_31858 [Blyttiomyces helicus]